MHWQSTQVTVGAVNSRQRAPWLHRAQGGTGLHWSLLCQRSSKNLQPGHLPAVFTTLSSKLKESEVKGSRERERVKCKLKRQYAGTQRQRWDSNPRDVGRSHWAWGTVWKDERNAQGKAELFASGTAGPRRPLFTQATMLFAFIAGMQLVSDTKWLYRTFQTLLLGQSLQP